VFVGRDIARALGELHAMGIVAMDVKPDNILMTDSDVAVLADFGISKVLAATTAAMSTARDVRGTYAYT
jgi:serine/threonine protein kinase